MYTSKTIFIISAILAVSAGSSFAQTIVKTDTVIKRKQSFVLHIGGGISGYTGNINIKPIELPGSIKRSSAATTIRLMWYPNHRLRLGVESGYTNFYSYSIKNGNNPGKVNLTAIPLLVVWSMPVIRRVTIFAGFGSYFLTTHLNYLGKVDSKQFVLGSNIALSYTYPVSKRLGIAAEGKWMNAFETKDTELSLQLQLVWKVFQWD